MRRQSRNPRTWLRTFYAPHVCVPSFFIFLSLLPAGYSADPTQRIGQEENRTAKIGEQTQLIAQELEAIVRDLEMNKLLTRDENKDFSTAQKGLDEIPRREVRSVLEQLIAARQALDRARRQEHLRQTVGAQEQLIARLTEELVRIQYRSQLRHLLDQMRTLVADQRQAIRATQNGAIELAATTSDALREDILDRVTQGQDAIANDWALVRTQVAVILERFHDLPFLDTIRKFQDKASALPVEQRLSETRDHLQAQRLGLAVAGQRQLAEHFLVLLKILQESGLSPAEQRSALENVIEKTEEALRQQQDLRAQTEALGRDLTEPLRNEMARAEDQLANFTRELSQEADQAIRAEQTATPQSQPATSNVPSQSNPSAIANPQSAVENPWAEAKKQIQPPPTDAPAPATPAGQELTRASEKMSEASNQLNLARAKEASASQQQAISHLAGALASMREQLEKAQKMADLEALADMLAEQSEVLNQLGEIIRDQEDLTGRTQQAAQQAKAGSTAPQPEQSAKNTPQQPAGRSPQSPSELGEAQKQLSERTQDFAEQVMTAPGVPQPLAKAVEEMDRAAAQLGESKTGEALPHQGEALRSLREAERKLAEAMAQALDAQEMQQWLDQLSDLDAMIGRIEQMAGEAEALPEAPAPALAQQAEGVAQELGYMAAMPPMTPAMAAQVRQGSKMMSGASQELQQGQTGQAAQTMHQAAQTLGGVRGQMAQQIASDLAQAQAQAQAAAQAQQSGRPSPQASANAAKKAQPTNKPSQMSKGDGMRAEGPTAYDPKQIEKDMENGNWSRLPEREREQVLQALREKYPPRYERALIRYYRNLSRVEGAK
ncbi:MAG: DUF4175 domain-containing protein [Candidatus Sumerlaeia bacterium]|nr:DUF4175 domain-containing protein [Candidatus Sumerlaeia bacterium]